MGINTTAVSILEKEIPVLAEFKTAKKIEINAYNLTQPYSV